jgi:hypothetical protein
LAVRTPKPSCPSDLPVKISGSTQRRAKALAEARACRSMRSASHLHTDLECIGLVAAVHTVGPELVRSCGSCLARTRGAPALPRRHPPPARPPHTSRCRRWSPKASRSRCPSCTRATIATAAPARASAGTRPCPQHRRRRLCGGRRRATPFQPHAIVRRTPPPNQPPRPKTLRERASSTRDVRPATGVCRAETGTGRAVG